jgi:hypothetical protein
MSKLYQTPNRKKNCPRYCKKHKMNYIQECPFCFVEENRKISNLEEF